MGHVTLDSAVTSALCLNEKLAANFAPSSSARKVDVVLSALIAVPLIAYMIGVYRTLAAADRTKNVPWPMVFLYGAVMMSATAGPQ